MDSRGKVGMIAAALFLASAATQAIAYQGNDTGTSGQSYHIEQTEEDPAPGPAMQPHALDDSETRKLDVLLTTFDRDRSSRYDCCIAQGVFGGASAADERVSAGVPYTPSHHVRLRKIQLGLHYHIGTNVFYVSIRKDIDGVPGDIIRSFEVAGVNQFGECCSVVTVDTHSIDLYAGTYWIVVKAKGDTIGDWNWNSSHARGLIALNEGAHDWTQVDNQVIPALRLLGKRY